MRHCDALSIFSETEHQSLDAFLQNGHVEVEQQRQLPFPQLEIGERLGSVHWEDSFDRLYLDHHGVADKHIETKAALKLHVFVNHRHRLLHSRRKASQSELVGERPFVSCFGFPGSKFAMHLDGRADDFMGKLVRSHRRRVIVTKRGVNSTEAGDNSMASSCATETAETRWTQRRQTQQNLCVLRASAVYLRPPFAPCSQIAPPDDYRITGRPNPSKSDRQYASEQVVTVAPGDRTNVKVVNE